MLDERHQTYIIYHIAVQARRKLPSCMNLKNKAQALASLGLVPCKATNRAMLGFKLHPIVAYCCNLFSLDILHSIAPNCILHMVHSCCGKQIQRFTLRWKCGSAHYRIRWGGGWSSHPHFHPSVDTYPSQNCGFGCVDDNCCMFTPPARDVSNLYGCHHHANTGRALSTAR